MSLNISKLENVKRQGTLIFARCPACAQEGHDNKGEHLSIDQNGRFGCVVHPGESGHIHRKKIYELVGQKQNRVTIAVKLAYVRADYEADEIIEKDILGRLGRIELTRYKGDVFIREARLSPNADLCDTVPCVPD